MTVMSYDDFCSKYDEAVKKCKESGQPIYLANNGQVELVVMDIASFERREQKPLLRGGEKRGTCRILYDQGSLCGSPYPKYQSDDDWLGDGMGFCP